MPLPPEENFKLGHYRTMTDGERFSAAVRGIVGKRLMFDQLTGKSWDATAS
jgi:hypothetical protein